MLRFNADGPDGLATRKAPGRTSILNDEQRTRLAAIVEAGPIPAAHGVVRWRLVDLGQWIWDEFELYVTRHTPHATRHTLGRELRAMGYRKLSARPRHRGQKGNDIVDFKRLRCPSGEDQAKAPERKADRAVVAGCGPRRPADQAHQALGQPRHPAIGTQGPAAILSMVIRCDLSG
ncbi:hypothetical protein NRB_12490 [Novosphingobium sp. 11B]